MKKIFFLFFIECVIIHVNAQIIVKPYKFTPSKQVSVEDTLTNVDSIAYYSLLHSKFSDQFDGTQSFNTPYFLKDNYTTYNYTIGLLKCIINGKSFYTLRLTIIGQTCVLYKKGTFVLFSDGTKFTNFTEEIDNEVDDAGYRYTVSIPLTINNIDLFSTKLITGFKLYIFPAFISNEISEKMKSYFKVIKIVK